MKAHFEILNHLLKEKVVAIVRLDSGEKLVQVADAAPISRPVREVKSRHVIVPDHQKARKAAIDPGFGGDDAEDTDRHVT